MKPIQMVDTKTQYLHLKPAIDAAIQEVLDTAAYINGKATLDFTSDLNTYLDSQFTIPCANGTDALQIAMMALDLKPGDEVIVPSFTYIATTEAVALLGIKPVFVDVDKTSFCIDPKAVEAAITKHTKAIMPVHLYGQAAPMEAILEIAKKHNLYVIEDNAQALGAVYTFSDGTKKKTGTMGDIGCTSFYPSKNLGAYGDGGAIFTQQEHLAEKIKMIANHGQSKRYYHDIVGCNSRLDSIQAAVLGIKLKHLDNYNLARKKVADYYNQVFEAYANILITPKIAEYSTHVFHQYTLQIIGKNRDALQAYLAEHKIPSMIYYPVPCHKQAMFKAFSDKAYHLPITDGLTQTVLSLPIHTEMEEEQLNYITRKLIDYVQQ